MVKQPLGDGTVASPTFEVHHFATDDPSRELLGMAGGVVEHHGDLDDVAAMLTRMPG